MFDLTTEQEIKVMLKAMATELETGRGDLEWQVMEDEWNAGVNCRLWQHSTGIAIIENCENTPSAQRTALQRWFDMNEATPF